MTIPLCRLRAVLNEGLDDLGTVIRRLRESGLLPEGKGGRDGVGSARLDARDAALTLLAMAATSWCEPCEAPREAERIADFMLRDESGPRVIDVLAGEILAIALDAPGAAQHYQPGAWTVSRYHVHQQALGLTFAGDASPAQDRVVRSTVLMPGVIEDVAGLFRQAA